MGVCWVTTGIDKHAGLSKAIQWIRSLTLSNSINDLSILEPRELLSFDVGPRLDLLKLLQWPGEELPDSFVRKT